MGARLHGFYDALIIRPSIRMQIDDALALDMPQLVRKMENPYL